RVLAPQVEVATFTLTVKEGCDQGQRSQLDPKATQRAYLGTSAACDVRLTDPLVSRRHAAFELVRGQLHLIDLDSKDGTFVTGIRIANAYLRGGEVLRFGDTLVDVELEPTRAVVALPAASSFGRVLGASPEMRRLYPSFERLALSLGPVILEGETGTGK